MGDGYSLIVYSKVTLPPWEETLALCLLCQSKWPLETECRLSPGVLPSNCLFYILLAEAACQLLFKILPLWLGWRYLCSKDLHKEGQCLPHVQSLPAEQWGWVLSGLQTLERRYFINFWLTCSRWKTLLQCPRQHPSSPLRSLPAAITPIPSFCIFFLILLLNICGMKNLGFFHWNEELCFFFIEETMRMWTDQKQLSLYV